MMLCAAIICLMSAAALLCWAACIIGADHDGGEGETPSAELLGNLPDAGVAGTPAKGVTPTESPFTAVRLIGLLAVLAAVSGCGARTEWDANVLEAPRARAAEAEALAGLKPGVPGYAMERAVRICPLFPLNRQASCFAALL